MIGTKMVLWSRARNLLAAGLCVSATYDYANDCEFHYDSGGIFRIYSTALQAHGGIGVSFYREGQRREAKEGKGLIIPARRFCGSKTRRAHATC